MLRAPACESLYFLFTIIMQIAQFLIFKNQLQFQHNFIFEIIIKIGKKLYLQN